MSKRRGIAAVVQQRHQRQAVDERAAEDFERRFATPEVSHATTPAPSDTVSDRGGEPPPASAGGPSKPKRTKKKNTTKGERFVVLLPPDVISRLKVAATQDGRSYGNATEAAILHWLDSGRPDPIDYEVDQ